jgi:hypothetical protein
MSRNLEEYDDISQAQDYAPTDYSRRDFESDWATIGREEITDDRSYQMDDDDYDFYSDYGRPYTPGIAASGN